MIMPWFPVGACYLSSTSVEVAIGHVSGVLSGGLLHLRLDCGGGSDVDPLSFLIVDLLGDDEIRPLGSEKFWPKREPAAMRLGPCAEEAVSGVVTLRSRSINKRRLAEREGPRFLPVRVEAFLPSQPALPRFTPAGFARGEQQLQLSGGPIGPGGAWPVRLSDD
jgi:hypothetical protein